jgi:hypothetical protein
MKICPKCGHRSEAAEFCRECGAKLEVEAASQPSPAYAEARGDRTASSGIGAFFKANKLALFLLIFIAASGVSSILRTIQYARDVQRAMVWFVGTPVQYFEDMFFGAAAVALISAALYHLCRTRLSKVNFHVKFVVSLVVLGVVWGFITSFNMDYTLREMFGLAHVLDIFRFQSLTYRDVQIIPLFAGYSLHLYLLCKHRSSKDIFPLFAFMAFYVLIEIARLLIPNYSADYFYMLILLIALWIVTGAMSAQIKKLKEKA